MTNARKIASLATLLNGISTASSEIKPTEFTMDQGYKDIESIAWSAMTLDFEALGPEFFKLQNDLSTGLPCYACRAFTELSQEFYDTFISEWLVVEATYSLCGFIIPKVGYSPTACKGIINDQFRDTILPIIRHKVLSK